MKNNSEKISYCVGFQAGENIKHMLKGTDVRLLSKGFNDSIGNRTPALELREIEATLKVLAAHMQKENSNLVEELAEKNKEQQAAFFEKIKAEKDVKSLSDGIQYKMIKSGSGETPSMDGSIIFHLGVTLLDGTSVENSFAKNTPRQLHMSKIGVPGLSKALLRMKVGDRWKLFLPSEQAFGINGLPQRNIEPGAALIYEVELLQVLK